MMMFGAGVAEMSVLGGDRKTRFDPPDNFFPKDRHSNPWLSHDSSSLDDFILIAEFSEREGPKPVLVIPKDGGQGFDQNEFSVRILAVDHHSSVTDGFHLTEDNQVVMEDSKNEIYTFIELMVYRAEYTNATVFRKLQEKIPQEPLSTAVKHKISEEFRSLPDLCQALDNLDIAISFLKSIGGNPGNNLDKFMVETLKMEQSLYSPKARQICQYRHAQSLWLLLSLEKNKQLARHNQVIFDGLPEQFHEQLGSERMEQVMTFLQPLSLEKLGFLLELMFECIVLVISVPQNQDNEDYVNAKEKKFKDYLLALMNEKEVELHFGLDVFPDNVQSKFCVSTWTLAYQHMQEKKRQGS